MHCVNLLNFFEYFEYFFDFPSPTCISWGFVCTWYSSLGRTKRSPSVPWLYRYSFFPPIALQLLICPNIRNERSNLVCFLDSIVLQKTFVRSLCWVTESLLNWKWIISGNNLRASSAGLTAMRVQCRRGKGWENMIRCRLRFKKKGTKSVTGDNFSKNSLERLQVPPTGLPCLPLKASVVFQ